MNEVRRLRGMAGVTQAVLASAAGTSQPTVAAYEAGRKSPTLATLRRLAESVGVTMSIEFHAGLTREERRSLFLHRAIAERLASDPERVLERARATLRRMLERRSPAGPLLVEWTQLLQRPTAELIEVLIDPAPHARELRHVTPFAGVFSARERAAIYRAFARAERAA
jgi:transcriptional regulator with XRE-family HTH domain